MKINVEEVKIGEAFAEIAEIILGSSDVYKATKYLARNLTVKGTRKRFHGKIDSRSRIAEILFTVGAPNYEERKAIKKFKGPLPGIHIKKIKGGD
jgi:hypothetical protein